MIKGKDITRLYIEIDNKLLKRFANTSIWLQKRKFLEWLSVALRSISPWFPITNALSKSSPLITPTLCRDVKSENGT